MAGYSGTPLARKLGLAPGHRAALYGAPDGFEATLEGLPEGVAIERDPRGKGPFDVQIAFALDLAALAKRFAAAKARMTRAGGLWVAWPKLSSGVESELRESVVREHGLQQGLVDVKVCAVDDTWSGLKFVVRTKDR